MFKRKSHILIFGVIFAFICSCTSHKNRSIVVLCDNDVHCAIDGYSKFAGYRDAVKDTAWTITASCGDYLQGGTHGAISKGQYIIDIMKHVKYDVVTLGNHEFDYGFPTMLNLLGQLNVDVVNGNLVELSNGNNVFKPYIIKEFDGRKVAVIGLTTPTTMQTESYAFFDKDHNQTYELMNPDFYGMVQEYVDDVRKKGVDFVIVICHLGEDPTDINIDSRTLISNTTGIDVVLDGHTHSVIQPVYINNKEGKPVITLQTGTAFKNIGKVVISPNNKISAELIPVENITNVNIDVQNTIDSIKNVSNSLINRFICDSDVELSITDGEGNQLTRLQETTAGNIVCDAFRILTGSDVAVNNGGGIRNSLKSGKLTYGDVVSLLPYDNNLMVVEVPGSKIVELLEANTSLLPLEDGQFPQVSGLKFTVSISEHKVSDVMVLNKDTQEYEPIQLDKRYPLTTTDYCVNGGGMRDVLRNSDVIQDAAMPYADALVEYVQNVLNGHIGSEYSITQDRITIVK